MTDVEFVTWYVDKIYIFTGKRIKRKYISGDTYGMYEFCNEVKSSLGLETISGKKMSQFLINLFNDRKKEYKSDLLDYIRYKYKITLGYRNWEIVTLSGKQVNKAKIKSDMKEKYDDEFISEVIDEWFENEIITMTEKVMSKFN